MKRFSFLKKIMLPLLLLLGGQSVFAQTDTADAPRIRALDRYAELFGTKKPTSFLIKWNALAALPDRTMIRREENDDWEAVYNQQAALSFEFEGKISRAFSANASLGLARYRFNQFNLMALESSLEPRFFFEMHPRLRGEKQANNLIGNYLAVEYRFFQAAVVTDSTLFEQPVDNSMTLRLGMQRRFFRQGWFDLSLGFGQTWRSRFSRFTGDYVKEKRTIFDPRLRAGLAFGNFSERKKIGKKPRCEAFDCDFEEIFWTKLDLFQLFRQQPGGFRGKASLAWELRFGRAPLSVELEASVPYNYVRQNFGGASFFSVSRVGFGVAGEPRVFLMKWQRARGVVNFNGLFAGFNYYADWNLGQARQTRSTLLLGLQSRLFERWFASYKIGYGSYWRRECVDNFFDFTCTEYRGKHLFSELKIGLAW